ncbi:MAG: hypothetical protein K2H06_04905 [Anaeroplasmataceae bacterium]|nr:hypothetical protein [Anaeroplasmataceae bacterium]
MKKVLKGLLFAFVGVFALVLMVSCSGHEHKAKEGWKRDSAQHWHECEGCDEMLDVAAHEYGAWTIDVEVDHTNNKDGLRHKDCKVCGFTMKDTIKAMPVLYVRGGINGWGAPEEYKLTINTDNGSETIKGVVFAVNDEWKIADAKWSDSANFDASYLDEDAKAYFGGNGNIVCKVAGTYTITITNVLSGAKISVEKTA